MAIPAGYAGLILPVPGWPRFRGVTVLNAPGLNSSSNYRGEIKVILGHLGLKTEEWTTAGDEAHWHQHNIEGFAHICKGHRIAQLVVIKVETADFVAVEELGETEHHRPGSGVGPIPKPATPGRVGAGAA